MKKVYKQITFEKPDNIVCLGNGLYWFNYGIEDLGLDSDPDGNDVHRYASLPVLVPKADYKTCVKRTIAAYISQDEEFDLINSYNKAVLNNDTESEDIAKYKDYISLVEKIKDYVKSIFDK